MTAKLKQLEGLEVIEKVNVPTNWINPLVAVEKPNGGIRICLDMRQANRAILKEKHPVPTLEETSQEISEDSHDVTTFTAPDGLYRYKRLFFGANLATEKIQPLNGKY